MDYTRSFWRRIGAALIDASIAHFVVILIFGWWALSLEAPLRFTGGFIYWSSCQEGTPKDSSSNWLKFWDKVKVCDRVADLVFPSRDAKFEKIISKTGNFTYSQTTQLDLDSRDVAVAPVKVDLLLVLFWWLGASAFEGSRWRATPGKRLLGLAVESKEHGLAGFWRASLRNFVKLHFLIYLMIAIVVSGIVLRVLWLGVLASHGTTFPDLPQWWSTLIFCGYCLFVLTGSVVTLSLIFPWRKMGRGIYDRIAGTLVVRV